LDYIKGMGFDVVSLGPLCGALNRGRSRNGRLMVFAMVWGFDLSFLGSFGIVGMIPFRSGFLPSSR
jgi:hypothetical protein